MMRNFEYLMVFTSAPDVLPEQNDRYRIQPWKVNEIKAYKKIKPTDAFEVELWHFKFVIVKFLVLRKWAAKLLLLKIL